MLTLAKRPAATVKRSEMVADTEFESGRLLGVRRPHSKEISLNLNNIRGNRVMSLRAALTGESSP